MRARKSFFGIVLKFCTAAHASPFLVITKGAIIDLFSHARVVGHLRSTRLNSEFIFCSVCSVSTFSAVLDSLEHADSGKNCPVKLFDVYLEVSGVLSGGQICH